MADPAIAPFPFKAGSVGFAKLGTMTPFCTLCGPFYVELGIFKLKTSLGEGYVYMNLLKLGCIRTRRSSNLGYHKPIGSRLSAANILQPLSRQVGRRIGLRVAVVQDNRRHTF